MTKKKLIKETEQYSNAKPHMLPKPSPKNIRGKRVFKIHKAKLAKSCQRKIHKAKSVPYFKKICKKNFKSSKQKDKH